MAYLESCPVIPFENPMPLLEVELIIYPTKETSLCVLYVQNNGLSMCILSHSETSKQTYTQEVNTLNTLPLKVNTMWTIFHLWF